MNTLRFKQILTVWFVFSLVQTYAQNLEKEVQNPDRSTKVNNINKEIPNRISMNVTVPKQTQGATFGEKVKAGSTNPMNSKTDDASLMGVVTGSITWNFPNTRNETETSSVSSVGNLSGSGSGAAAASYAATGRTINPSTPIVVSVISVRESMAAGITGGVIAARKEYQPVYFEGHENTCTDCVLKMNTNPYFVSNEMTGEMTLSKNKPATGVEDDCNGVEGLTVSLINEQTGSVVANVITERCGDFYFENLPKASYIVKFDGEFIAKKIYDVDITKNGTYDLSGELLSAKNEWNIKINTALAESPNSDEKVNAGLHAAGSAVSQGASLLGGALPGGAVISSAISKYSPGEPIPGIDVKLRKASTELDITSKTNEKGQFEFIGLSQGNYKMTSILPFHIDGAVALQIWFSKKGYDYYQSKSSINNASEENEVKGNNQNELKRNDAENAVVAKEKKGLNAVNVKTSKVNSDTKITSEETQRKGWDGTVKGKVDETTLTTTLSKLEDFKNSFVELEKIIGQNKRQSINAIKIPVQINNVRNRISQLENSLKNLRLMGKTAPALSDLNARLDEMDNDFSVLTENLDQFGEQYNAISNVLKTKHDTAKNSVGNIR